MLDQSHVYFNEITLRSGSCISGEHILVSECFDHPLSLTLHISFAHLLQNESFFDKHCKFQIKHSLDAQIRLSETVKTRTKINFRRHFTLTFKTLLCLVVEQFFTAMRLFGTLYCFWYSLAAGFTGLQLLVVYNQNTIAYFVLEDVLPPNKCDFKQENNVF